MFLLNKVIYHCNAIEYSHDTSNTGTGIQKSNMFHKSAILECHMFLKTILNTPNCF